MAPTFPTPQPSAPLPGRMVSPVAQTSHRAPRGVGDSILPNTPPELDGRADSARPAPSAPSSELPAPAESPARSLSPAPAADPGPARQSIADLETAQANAHICDRFLQMMEAGHHSLTTAAKLLGKSPSFFSGRNSMLSRYLAGGLPALLPPPVVVHVRPLTEQIEALGWFIPAARFFNLLTNRTHNSGSVPEAIRRALSLPAVPVGWRQAEKTRLLRTLGLAEFPVCPPDLRETCLARERSGQPLVPERVARQIAIRPATVKQHRNPTEAALDLLNSPGGMRLFTDPATGRRRLARALEIVEADDATINFPVCVPWERDGSDDPCVRKYGVRLARFQWLVAIDAGTSYVLGYTYTARPRSSYRAEDILSLLRAVSAQHGIPATWRFERGAWESKRVKDAIRLLGCQLDTVYSPHQKPFIEGLFNQLWTKFSVQFPTSDVGRFRGETEASNTWLTKCQSGAHDPRDHFPMLADALDAMDEVIAERNRTPVTTQSHGRWVPADRFTAELNSRPLSPDTEWMFAPHLCDWTVRGMTVGGKVLLIDGAPSVPFAFSAPWLAQYDGAPVRAYFDPSAPKCHATLVLAQAWHGRPAGEILGLAGQIGEAAAYARLVLGYGDDPEGQGPAARSAAAAALRREVRGIAARPGARVRTTETRDGVGGLTKIETGLPQPAPGEAPADHPPQRGALPAPAPRATRPVVAPLSALDLV